jgi:hypothetical protein
VLLEGACPTAGVGGPCFSYIIYYDKVLCALCVWRLAFWIEIERKKPKALNLFYVDNCRNPIQKLRRRVYFAKGHKAKTPLPLLERVWIFVAAKVRMIQQLLHCCREI